MGGKGKKRDETGRKSAIEASRVVDWGGGGRQWSFVILIPPQTPLLASLADFFSLFPSLRSLVPGYYNICNTDKLNFTMILFLGDRNKYHVTITSQHF